MDVDSSSPNASQDVLTYFELSPTSFPWRAPVCEDIQRRRAALNDTLLFDILLSLGGIEEPESLYPPPNPDALQRLITEITESSDYDGLKKDGLRERSLPPQFVALADAYWCLDSGLDIPRAVSQLSDPRLNRDYASKIIQIISQCKDPQPEPLIVKYVRTAKPRLEEAEDIDAYALALAHQNLFEAWQFQRTFNETHPSRERLLKELIRWSVSPTPKPSALTSLLTLPLSAYEQNVLHSYASSPPKDDTLPVNAVPTLQNLACVRLIQIGKHAEAVKMHRSFIATATSGKGKDTDAIPSVQSLFQERDEMIQEVYNALPQIERHLLDAELESGGLGTIHQSVPLFKSRPSLGSSSHVQQGSTSTADASGDISMSWEDIPRPPLSSINGKTPTRPASGSGNNTPLNFSLSAAPKFGGSVFSSSVASPASNIITPNGTPLAQKPLEGLPPPSLSATALNLFGLATSTSGKRKSGGFTPLSSSMTFGDSFSSSTSSRPPIISTSALGSSTASNPVTNETFASSFGASMSSNSNGLFASSARKENAFFKPPSQLGNGVIPGSGRRQSESKSPERPTARDDSLNVDGDAEMEVDELNINGRDSDNEAGLSYSVFGGRAEKGKRSTAISSGWQQPTSHGISARGGDSEPQNTSISTMTASTSSRLPGSFMDEDEEDDVEHEQEDTRETRRSSRKQRPQQQQQTRQTRGTRKSNAPATISASTTSTVSNASRGGRSRTTRQSISAASKHSVPGAMYDEDDEDGASTDRDTIHEEAEDDEEESLAPLPAKRAPKKTRSSMLVDEDGHGASKTRRRSTRLSTTSTDAATSSRKATRASTSKGETTGKSSRKKR